MFAEEEKKETRVIKNIWQLFHIDLWLLLGITAVVLYGVFVLYSATGGSDKMLNNRLWQIALGVVFMIVLAQFTPRTYQRLAPVLYVMAIILLLLVDLVGTSSKGAQRWLNFGVFRFQPAEIAKIAVPLMVAYFLGNKSLPPKFSDVLVALILIIVPTLMIAVQPDLGTSVLVCGTGLFIVFLAGMRWRLILSAVIAIAGLLPLVWFYYMHGYQRARVLTFLSPENDPLGAGYHIIQSKIAIGSGGLLGKGWLHGTQSQLEFLPEPHTDFIFAVLGEEQGLVGVLILLFLYLCIIARGLMMSVQAQSAFERILSGALTLIFFVYVFVNIGMVSGLLPVVGVPLPLVSYGGTSFVTLMSGFGIMMSFHTHRQKIHNRD